MARREVADVCDLAESRRRRCSACADVPTLMPRIRLPRCIALGIVLALLNRHWCMTNHKRQDASPDDAVPRSGSEEAGPRRVLTAETTDLIHRAFAAARTDNLGWAYLPELESKLRSIDAGFRPSHAGSKTLLDLLKACHDVETRLDRTGAIVARLRVASNWESQSRAPVGPMPVSLFCK